MGVWGLWRENWLLFWITATAREGMPCCGGRVEGAGRRMESLWGLVGVWAGAVSGGGTAGGGLLCAWHLLPAACCLLTTYDFDFR